MKSIKLVVIGGGSSYTPELMEGFINRYNEFPITDIWLVDVEEGKERVEIVRTLSQRMWNASGHPVEVRATLNRQEALPDATFVITQFRVGQLYSRIKDERIPLSHGVLGQETNGAGGIFKALRTIPVIKEIVGDMRRLCPDAWLMNFTNPSGIVTEAVIKHMDWKRCIGLCNVPTIAMMKEPALLGKNGSTLLYRFFGLNHFHWHRVTDQAGNDLTAQIIDHINDRDGGTPVNITMEPFSIELLQASNLLPSGYHRYYYNEKEMLEKSLADFQAKATRAEQVLAVEKELFETYADQNLHQKPASLDKRGGAYYSETACECISSIHGNKGSHIVVSTENRGAIPFLDSDSVVEISSIITANGAEPIVWGGARPLQKGYLQMMKAMEESVIEAALHGDYGMLFEAFILNPLILNSATTQVLLDEMLVANEKYLPQFAAKIAELKAKGVWPKDSVVQDLLNRGL